MKGIEFEMWCPDYSEYVLKYMIVSERMSTGFKKKYYLNWIKHVGLQFNQQLA